MKKILQKTIEIAALGLLLILLTYLILNLQSSELATIAKEHRFIGAGLVALIMFATTVIAPLTSLPLVPVVAPLLGPFTTGTACFVGWFTGALCAFFVGRRYGKPFVARHVSLEKFHKYEKYLKPEMEFIAIVALRIIIPVDVLSYLLGILSKVTFRVYAGATAVGILWFSFAFAYIGSAVIDHHYVLLASISVASMVVLYGAWWYLQKVKQK